MSEKPRNVYSGIYQHYKGSLYFVLGVARHTETDEKLIAYIPLYTTKNHKGPRIQVRPFEMFFEKLESKGHMVPRFRYLSSELI